VLTAAAFFVALLYCRLSLSLSLSLSVCSTLAPASNAGRLAVAKSIFLLPKQCGQKWLENEKTCFRNRKKLTPYFDFFVSQDSFF
jgi:hypothetical protein